ncbi:MAG: ATP-binding protein, partial [Eubacteriales bacterium]|nr:ATP-binding protein [Eubacteriales bacterium]
IILPGVYNLLSALKEADYHRGASYEALRQSIQNGESDTISMSLNGGNYFLAYYYLGIDDWTTILMIPDDSLGLGSKSLARVLTTNLVCIFLGMLAFILCLLMWFFMRNRRTQRKINEQLKKAAEAEKAANLAKTNFLSSMSHDIRTPLNAIVGILTLAKRRPEDNAYLRESMNKIGTAANQLLTLINDILDISKIESGEVQLNPEPFSVREFVNRIMSIVTPSMEEKHHTFTVEVHDIAHDRLNGDRLRLSQIYLNLLSNAVKYTDSQGEIHAEVYEQSVSGHPDQTCLVLSVRDNGVGMTEDFQKRMYQSFSRETDSRTNKIQGSGLGLAICKQIVELMGGEILCDSQEGKGTTFTVMLPITALPDAEVTETEFTEVDTSILKGMHLLVAEDNNVNWRIVRDLLEDEEITAERAENGQECLNLLEKAEENHFDAILMDVEMPVMNGKEATEHIRASQVPWIRDIPIFATTANAFAEDVKSCLDAGMNDHVSKPIDIETLLKKLALIRERIKK